MKCLIDLCRLSDNVDVGWAFAVAGLVVLIIISLFFVARCRLSMFTRKRKRINRPKKKSVVEVKEQERVKEEVKAKEEAPKVMAISAASKEREKLAEKSAKKKTKKDFIIEMIDSALDPVDDKTGLYDGHFDYSLESIDQISDCYNKGRRNSAVSVSLSLVFDKESDRPVFVRSVRSNKR